MTIKSYQELVAWQKAMDLVVATYEVTRSFPREEMYGLTSQLRRAAVSVPSNIAEGQGRRTTNEFVHFLSTAYGSLCEAETQFHIAQRLNYCPPEMSTHCLSQCSEVGRLLNGLMNSLRDSKDS